MSDDTAYYSDSSLETLSSVSSVDHIFLLHRRTRVLETLCGLGIHPCVVHAATLLQATVRGRILRRDKQVFDACVTATHARFKVALARRRFLRARRAARTLQAVARGFLLRTSVAGRAVQAYLEARHDVTALEILVLRLTRAVPCVARPQMMR